MDAQRVAALARQAYSEDARSDCDTWEYTELTECLMVSLDPVFLRFAELLQQELQADQVCGSKE